jgi:hypothetical protein
VTRSPPVWPLPRELPVPPPERSDASAAAANLRDTATGLGVGFVASVLTVSVVVAMIAADRWHERAVLPVGFVAAAASSALLGRLYWCLGGKAIAAGCLGAAVVDLVLATWTVVA